MFLVFYYYITRSYFNCASAREYTKATVVKRRFSLVVARA